MSSSSSTVLLTRPDLQSRSFLADLEVRLGFSPSCIVSPILRIVSVDGDVDLESFRTLIVTSGNAVEAMREHLKGRRVVTVGERTAELARQAGADAECFGDRVQSLVERLNELESPALHLRGRHSVGALTDRGRSLGVLIHECVVYDQVEHPLSEEAQKALTKPNVVLPLFSPRSAKLVSRYECHPSTYAIAMSMGVAEAWNCSTRLAVASRPDRAAMLDLVAAAF